MSTTVEHLAGHRELLPTIQAWFESEWPGYYGPGQRGNAQSDVLAYCNRGGLPVGLVAFREGEACGFAALKSDAFPSHPHLMPWTGAGYVVPSLRRQGIGAELMLALEREARSLGYPRLYCATGTSVSLLMRCGWQVIDRVAHDGQQISVFEKAL